MANVFRRREATPNKENPVKEIPDQEEKFSSENLRRRVPGGLSNPGTSHSVLVLDPTRATGQPEGRNTERNGTRDRRSVRGIHKDM